MKTWSVPVSTLFSLEYFLMERHLYFFGSWCEHSEIHHCQKATSHLFKMVCFSLGKNGTIELRRDKRCIFLHRESLS